MSTAYQVGSALGLAAMTAITPSDDFSTAFAGAAVIALAGALLAGLTLRSAHPAAGVAEPAQDDLPLAA